MKLFQILALVALATHAYGNTPTNAEVAGGEDDLSVEDVEEVERRQEQASKEKLQRLGGSAEPRERRDPANFVMVMDSTKLDSYPSIAKRHILIFTPSKTLDSVLATTLEAADAVLNPTEFDINKHQEKQEDGKKWVSSGGGAVLFLVVDAGAAANHEVLQRLKVSPKIKKPILRGIQFPSGKDMEIFKPKGKYSFKKNALIDLVNGLRLGTLKRVLTTEEVADDEQKGPLMKLTGKTIRGIAKNPTKDVVVFMYYGSKSKATFGKVFEQVAKKSNKRETGLVFAHIDLALNGQDVLDLELKEFPAVVMFPSQAKPSDKPQLLDFLHDAEGLEYFVDRARWYKDAPKVSSKGNSMHLWFESVAPLEGKTFHKFLQTYKQFLVMFWTESSLQSKRFRGEFAMLSEEMRKQNIPLGQVDCTKIESMPMDNGPPREVVVNEKLCQMHGVTGVPEVLWFDLTGYTSNLDEYNSHYEKIPRELLSSRGMRKFVGDKLKSPTHAEL